MSSGYDRALVERLLPAVWDTSYAYGMADPAAPDPEMPRTKPDPKVGGAIFAHLADINNAWEQTLLPPEERKALVLRYGLDWKVREIAYNLGVSKTTAQRWCDQGVGRVTAFLTGTMFEDEAEEAPA